MQVAELQAELANPDTYDDPDRLRELTTRHDAAKDRASALMTDYETIQRRLERAEAEL